MEAVSIFLKIFFALTAFFTVWIFYNASGKSKRVLIFILGWMALQFIVASTGFFDKTYAVPPRLMFQLLPAVIFILIPFLTASGRNFIDYLNIKQLTLIHTIRIPVEITLYYLFIANVIPQVMTFEGRNFDIIAGLTAPIIYYFGFVKTRLSNPTIILWNLLSLGLLINIIVVASLSAKSPSQQFGLGETNLALGHIPFNWLPSVVVPLVLFSHLATIKQLIAKNRAGRDSSLSIIER